MNKASKKLLFAMIEKADGQGTNFIFEHQETPGRVCYYSIASEIGIDENECSGIINYLKKIGYLVPRCYSGKKGKIEFGVSLSYEALHYQEFKFLTQKERWKERLFGFLSGVAVSVISGIIASLILGR